MLHHNSIRNSLLRVLSLLTLATLIVPVATFRAIVAQQPVDQRKESAQLSLGHSELAETVQVVPGEVVFALKEEGSAASVAAEYDLTLDLHRERRILSNNKRAGHPYIARLSRETNLDEVIQYMQRDPRVVYAEKHILIPIFPIQKKEEHPITSADGNPQDAAELRDQLQWFLKVLQVPDGFSANTTVAVIDTGVSPASDQLRQAIVPGGYDFVNDNNDYSDPVGHGTLVAGEISGQYGMGSVPILPLKVFAGYNDSGQAMIDLVAVVDALRYATDKKARVINMSFGGPGQPPEFFLDALRYAGSHGVLAVMAAGNDRSNNDQTPVMPANSAATEWNALSVGATDKPESAGETLAEFSNWGPISTQVAAPGAQIFAEQSTTASFTWIYGTSFAAPIVSGLLAKAFDLNTNLSNDVVAQAKAAKEAALCTGDTLDSLVGKIGSASRVNVSRLIGNVRNPEPQFSLPAFQAIKKAQTVFTLNVVNPSSGMLRYAWDFGDSKRAESDLPTMQHRYKKKGSYTLVCQARYFTGRVFAISTTVKVVKP